MMSAMEADDLPFEDGEEPEAVLGDGDLLDDFISSAQTPADAAAGPDATAASQPPVLTPPQAAAAARLEAARRAGARAAAADGSSSDDEEFDSQDLDWPHDGDEPGELVPTEEWLRACHACASPSCWLAESCLPPRPFYTPLHIY